MANNDDHHEKNLQGASSGSVIANPWRSLRRYTDARIGIGRSGISQPTSSQLQFQLDHARARDSVRRTLDWTRIETPLLALGIPLLDLHSRATDRETYLQRPDLGRLLNPESERTLVQWRRGRNDPVDVCIAIADGLSATAVEQQAPALVERLMADLGTRRSAIICLVRQGRVAISDEIASRLETPFLALLVGERPGLSSPNSLGIYFTYRARPGFTDAQRNCISNIRPEGLSIGEASQRLCWLMDEAERIGESGVRLKDTRLDDSDVIESDTRGAGNFLVGE